MLKPLLVAALCLAPALAHAKPWMGITPQESTRADVVQHFGEPSKKVKQAAGGKETLAYTGDHAIKGTSQAQFVILPDGKVEQIVVFPARALELMEIEEVYGKACSAVEKAGQPVPPCYHRQLTDDFRPYFWYKRLGLVIFFNEDGRSVYSIVFNAPASANATAVTN